MSEIRLPHPPVGPTPKGNQRIQRFPALLASRITEGQLVDLLVELIQGHCVELARYTIFEKACTQPPWGCIDGERDLDPFVEEVLQAVAPAKRRRLALQEGFESG